MNKIFKVKKNSRGLSVATSELAKGHGKLKAITVAVISAVAVLGGVANATSSTTASTDGSSILVTNQVGALTDGQIFNARNKFDDEGTGSSRYTNFSLENSPESLMAKGKNSLVAGLLINSQEQGGAVLPQSRDDIVSIVNPILERNGISTKLNKDLRSTNGFALGEGAAAILTNLPLTSPQTGSVMSIGSNSIAYSSLSNLIFAEDDTSRLFVEDNAPTGALSLGADSASYYESTALGHKSLSIKGSFAGGGNSLAINASASVGEDSLAKNGSVAIGYYTNALQEGVALGYQSNAEKQNSIAIGVNATSKFANSFAFGKNSKTTQENQVVFGEFGSPMTLSNVKNAELYKNSTEAVNGSQLLSLAKATLTEIDVAAWRQKLGVTSTTGGSVGTADPETTRKANEALDTANANKGNIETLTYRLGETDRKLGAAETALGAAQQDIGTLQTDVGALKTDIEDVKGDITDINGKLANLDTISTTANDAKRIADEVKGQIADVDTTAKRADETANRAEGKANDAKQIAETAKRVADGVDAKAEGALTKANEAETAATSAKETAGRAETTAGQALQVANGLSGTVAAAEQNANTAIATANAVKGEFDGFKQDVSDIKSAHVNLTQDVAGLKGQVAQNAAQIDKLGKELRKTRKQADAGASSAIAIASIPQVTSAGKTSFGVGVGGYRGENAVAIGVTRASENGRHIIKLSTSVDTRKGVGYGAGYSFQF